MNNDVFYQCSSSMASFKSMNCCLQVLLVVHFFNSQQVAISSFKVANN